MALLLNHEPDTVMARVSNKTLSLREDDDGLFFEATLDPRDSDAQRTFAKIERGNITQMSFGFQTRKDTWTEEDEESLPLRELQDLDLWDVSPVTYPAYDETDVQAREYARGRAVVPPRPDRQQPS
ncbi:MAG TPA: HK97 family phage prohead protease, partial [Thiohalobacter sp.]|nr:HK97 family phage prohead protease [Thiohalobacter sp.]